MLIVAVLISVGSVLYARRQTRLMESAEARRRLEDAVVREWLEKFDEAVRQVMKIAPRVFADSLCAAYSHIFSDQALRQRIETYLIYANLGQYHFSARQASGEHLRMPIVQRTILEVLERVKTFKETEPDNARKLGL